MLFRPTAAMGTYLAGALTVQCKSIEEVRSFLRRCRYVSDFAQFGVAEYWMHPSAFETARKGDCEDFALWTWRQLLELGLQARFVVGRAGYGQLPHAWVTFADSGTHYLVEATAARWRKLSRLATLMYQPVSSVSWENGRLVYHQYEPRDYTPSTYESLTIAAEWIPLMLSRTLSSLLLMLWHSVRRAAGALGHTRRLDT